MKIPSINVIISGNSSKKNNNVYVYVNVSERIRSVDSKVEHLARKIGNEDNEIAYKLYCRAFYVLSADKVWSLYELTQKKGRNPVRYLSWLLSNKIRRAG